MLLAKKQRRTFYFLSGSTQDWTFSGLKRKRPREFTALTVCPKAPGWRVPKSGVGELSPWQTFTHENGPWHDFGIGATGGREWSFSGTRIWYPACGLRHGNNGQPNNYGRYQWLWCTTASDIGFSYRFRYDEISVQTATGGVRGDGSSVRCIRE